MIMVKRESIHYVPDLGTLGAVPKQRFMTALSWPRPDPCVIDEWETFP